MIEKLRAIPDRKVEIFVNILMLLFWLVVSTVLFNEMIRYSGAFRTMTETQLQLVGHVVAFSAFAVQGTLALARFIFRFFVNDEEVKA